MDPSTAMEAATEGAKAVTKFQEILQKAFGPHWTRRQADADAYADEKKLQTIRDNPDLKIVYINGKMNACEKTPEALAYRAEQRMNADSIRQETNLENILEITSHEIQQAKHVSDEPVDDDWLTRFFNISKDVNSEKMQYIWAKILSGEIEKPGSFSLRTLDIVRNMNKADAERFQIILPLIVKIDMTLFITSNVDILLKYGITYASILALDDCGLINSRATLSINRVVTKSTHVTIHNDELLIWVKGKNDAETKISIGIHPLTRAGSELYSILSHAANNEYIEDLAGDIDKKNKKNVIVSTHKASSINGQNTNCQTNAFRLSEEDPGKE